MKKVFSLVIIFVLTLFFTSFAHSVFAEESTDLKVYFHVHQYDGDYSSTGIGVWDGTNWNDYADVVTSEDLFGGVIVKTYTEAEYVLVNNKTNVEFKPSKDVSITENEPKDVLLAPGNGQVFASIAQLSDPEVSEIHLYYVEGSKKIFTATEDLGHLFVVYGNPDVATDLDIYDDLAPTVSGNGTLGTTSDIFEFIYEGAAFDLSARIFMITVDADAAATTSISLDGTKTFTVDNTTLMTGDSQVIYIEQDQEDYVLDGVDFGESFELNFQLRAGNIFQPSTTIMTPTRIDAEFLMSKNPGRLALERFILKDKLGTVIPIESITHAHTSKLGTYTQTVTPDTGENYYTLRVDTNLDHEHLGLVGAMQGWNIEAPILSSGVDSNGYAIFEVATTEDKGGFKLLYDSDEDGTFTWDNQTYQVTPDDQPFDFDGDSVLHHFMVANVIVVGTFDATVTPAEGEKMLIIHLNDENATLTNVGVVGSVQGWDPGNAILPTVVDSYGYVVFEIPVTSATGDIKILLDDNDNGFDWDDSYTNDNISFDLGDKDELVVYFTPSATSFVEVGVGAVITPIDVKNFSVHVDEDDALVHGEEYFLSYIEVVDPEEMIVTAKAMPFNLSHKLVKGDAVEETGTLALTQKSIQIMINNRMNLLVELVNESKQAIAVEAYSFATTMGTYTETITPTGTENKVMFHVAITDTTVTALNQLGLVGSVQGWNPDNAINPTGTDSEGNYVFEIVSEDETGTIKILFDADGAFNWGDAEITPGDINFTLDGQSYLIEEGASSTGSVHHNMILSEANKLLPTETYYLKYTDNNGFLVYEKVLLDTEAPVLTAPLKPNAVFQVAKDATFNITNYFDFINFVDNRDGEISHTVTSTINTANLGLQNYTVEATDSWGNTTTQTWEFRVGSGPIITMTETSIDLDLNATLPTWASYATVDRGTIAVNSNQVDVTTAGTYYVIYTATDETGTSTSSLEVNVIAPEVEEEPSNNVAIIVVASIAGAGGLGVGAFFLIKKFTKVV